MKTTILGIASVAFLWSSGAAAAPGDPFPTCADAGNYGYNTVRYFVSSLYNRANCDRDAASDNEEMLTDLIPTYLADIARRSTPEKSACMLQGSNEGWLETMENEYADCEKVADFGAIQERLLGQVVGSLLGAFYGVALFPSVSHVSYYFGYPYSTMALTGTFVDCEAAIVSAASGVPEALVNTLVATACQ